MNTKRHNIIEIENERLNRALERLPQEYGDKLFTALRRGEIYLTEIKTFRAREQLYMDAVGNVAIVRYHDFNGSEITNTDVKKVDAWGLFYFLDELHKKDEEKYLIDEVIKYLKQKGDFVEYFELYHYFTENYLLRMTGTEFQTLIRSINVIEERAQAIGAGFKYSSVLEIKEEEEENG
jgi:GNAT superfamily N-acetyltransferase